MFLRLICYDIETISALTPALSRSAGEGEAGLLRKGSQ